MRILHFGDIHFGMENYGRLDPKTGLHSRFGDFLQAYKYVVDRALGEGQGKPVDMVIFAGDAFKTRDPSPTYLKAFAEGIQRIASAGIPVVMAVGNHDLPNATGKANTLDIFQALAVPNVYVSRQPELLKIKTKVGLLQVITLPWVYKSQILSREDVVGLTGEEINHIFHKRITDEFKLLLGQIKDDSPAVAIVHATVEGATFGSERSVLLGSDIVLPLRLLADGRLKYVALGHIHHYQVLAQDPPVVYSGSLERIDFAEEKEAKGFVIADIDTNQTSMRFVPVQVRRFLTIDVSVSEDVPDPTAAVLRAIAKEDIKEAIVRVIVACPDAKSSEIRETPIREALSEAHFIAGITKQVSRGERVSEEKGFSDTLLAAQPLEVLEEYWNERKLTPARIAKLRSMAKALLEEVEQQ